MMFRNILVAGTLVAASTAAFAQDSPGTLSMGEPGSPGAPSAKLQGPQPRIPKSSLPAFAKADTNGDGVIEWKEARAQHVPKRFFKKEDYEHNGKLDKTEWMAARHVQVIGGLVDERVSVLIGEQAYNQCARLLSA